MTVTHNIYQKQIKYHVFNAVTNSELTELVPVFTMRPAFPTSVKKVNTSFKNVWRTWGPVTRIILRPLSALSLDEGLNALNGKNPSAAGWFSRPIKCQILVTPFTSVSKYWQNKQGEWLCMCLCIFRKQIHLYSHITNL
jgi:hypothetical protein